MRLVDHPSNEETLHQIVTQMMSSRSSSSGTFDIDSMALDLATVAPPPPPERSINSKLSSSSVVTDRMVETGIELGGWQRIIHAAGMTRDKTLRNMDLQKAWWPVLQVNLQAVMAIDRALLATATATTEKALFSVVPTNNNDNNNTASPQVSASFVYFSSTSGIAGNAGQANYAASKAGLLGYATAVAQRHSNASNSNSLLSFRVVSPGYIASDMTARMPFWTRLLASRMNALGQAGTPNDVAAAVAFLSSSQAATLRADFNLRVCGLFVGGR